MKWMSEKRYERELEKQFREYERERYQAERFDRIEKRLFELQMQLDELKEAEGRNRRLDNSVFESSGTVNCDRRID